MRRDRLRLYPEHGAGPVWSAHGPVGVAQLQISATLASELEAWQRDHESDQLGLSEHDFDAMGSRLAQLLANETGREVEYDGRWFRPTPP